MWTTAGLFRGSTPNEAVRRDEPDLLRKGQPVEIDVLRERQHLIEHVNELILHPEATSQNDLQGRLTRQLLTGGPEHGDCRWERLPFYSGTLGSREGQGWHT